MKIDNRVVEILKKHDISAKISFGQNFLVDKEKIDAIYKIFNNIQSKKVIEIGCGVGTLTYGLINKFSNVIGYEIEEKMIKVLKKEYKEKNFQLMEEDFLKADLSYVDEETFIVGNIPYNITKKIIYKILSINKPISFALMVQKEVAIKYLFKDHSSSNNALSTYFALNGNYKILLDVPSSSFLPSPKVDSAFIMFEAKSADFLMLKKLEKLYINKNKTLRNNFINYGEDVCKKMSNVIDLSLRIHQLDLEQIRKLVELI